jgi:hypothetical protein
VQLIDGILCVVVARHGDEREAARFAGEFVLDEHHFADRAGRGEEILEVGLSGVEREVPHVEFRAHGLACFFLLLS